MRIGVISDTHIPEKAANIPQKILDEFKRVDMVLCAGDLVDLSVLEKLKKVCPDVRAVWGNMDYAEVKKSLPEKQIFSIGKYKIGLTHGCGAPATLIDFLTNVFKNEAVDLIVFGHSHAPVNEKKGKILFFNPGSPTDKIFAPYNSFGIIEIGDLIEARIIRI